VRRIGFIGLGHMGIPICRRLLEAGLALTVYNRTAEKANQLVVAGADLVGSPAELASRVDLVISTLADDQALIEVSLDEHGVLAGAKEGLLFVDMSTVSPAESARVAAACHAVGVDYLRAPVSGSTALAAAGKLTILASGPRARYEEALEVFKILGEQHFYLGTGEEARFMKLALNMMVGTTIAALSESLVLGHKAGLDWRQMLEVFCNSALASPLVRYKAPQLAERDFAPTFALRLMSKDFDLALNAASQLEVSAPVTALVRQLYQAAAGCGWNQRDFSAVLLFLERAAGVKVPDP
jgi:3-hydroxyisobutyrate dehydrogenase-like beta-hydroxyacid dehydrogenase